MLQRQTARLIPTIYPRKSSNFWRFVGQILSAAVTLGMVLFLILAGSVAGYAADLPGAKDPPFLKRYAGSEIISYRTRSFDQYVLSRESNFTKTDKVEGAATRTVYLVPAGHTGLEIERNYQSALSDAGFTQTFASEMLDPYWAPTWLTPFLHQLGDTYDATGLCSSIRYFNAKATKNGQDLNAAVMVCESGTSSVWGQVETGKRLMLKPAQVVVWVDEIASKAVAINMVEVKAEDMADALATKGNINLYGIYFDVDKTDIKPESDKTLHEVASLLKIDRSLKLEIGGHTDNTGDKNHNLKLSQDRAATVVASLVKNYGVDAARLRAQGYGGSKPVASNATEDGRAKNRRVELRKL
jgi:OOP family OmpA-OmpF porin